MSSRQYLPGFGNEFASEALAGALPRDQNFPQHHPLGLYIEQLTGTSFSAPRGVSRTAWTYRIRPAAMHKPFGVPLASTASCMPLLVMAVLAWQGRLADRCAASRTR